MIGALRGVCTSGGESSFGLCNLMNRPAVACLGIITLFNLFYYFFINFFKNIATCPVGTLLVGGVDLGSGYGGKCCRMLREYWSEG